MGFSQRLTHKVAVGGVAVLDKRALQRLLMRAFRRIYRLHGARVDACVIHRGRHRGRRWVEILHLLGVEPHITAKFSQLNGLFQRRPRMRAHQIRHHELLQAELVVYGFELPAKRLVHFVFRLTHHRKHRIAHMFRRHTQLAAHVIL